MEKIISIEEIEDFENDGFEIKTNKYIYRIFNCEYCCEYYNDAIETDNINDFIEMEISDITGTDTNLNTKTIQNKKENALKFVTFETPIGAIQFIANNPQNILFLKKDNL